MADQREQAVIAGQAHVEAAPDGVLGQGSQGADVTAHHPAAVGVQEPQPVAFGALGAQVHLPGPAAVAVQHQVGVLTGDQRTVVAAAAVHHDDLIALAQAFTKHLQERPQTFRFVEHRNYHTQVHPKAPPQLLPDPAVHPKQ